tara:strand:+ start:6 stop:1058 length:1053 start_codon:yes stop_codon:yes gene_type:complete
MKIEDIKNHEWTKIFADKFCTLQCSLLGNQHTKLYHDILRFGLHHVIYTSKKGYHVCYWRKDEWESYAKKAADLVIKDNKKIEEWCSFVKEKTVQIQNLMDSLAGKIISLKEFETLKNLLDNYNPFYTSVKHFVNFIPKDLQEKFLPMLDENRLFTENIFPNIEKFFIQLAKEIEKKEKVPFNLILELQYPEFQNYLKNSILQDKNILEQRYDHNVQLYENGVSSLLTGEEAEKIEDQIHNQQVSEEIKGQTGYPGIAKGKVKIIFDPNKASHFEKGDILVTNMTRPEFVPLMEKAAAIVTDSGGLLCHAAVVAREMKKTTLIGTEKATKILKDNDLVLVDAEKGIIKKL